MMLCGRIYAPMHLALAVMYAGHLHKKCSAVSDSPHLVHESFCVIPIMLRCLLSGQCPVRIAVILLMFDLLSERKYLEFFALMLMQFFDCFAWFMEFQCFLKDSLLHLLMSPLKYDGGTFSRGSAPIRGSRAPSLAKPSAISLPSMPLCPGTHSRETELFCASSCIIFLQLSTIEERIL